MANVLQIAGALITAVGVGLIFLPAGIILAGVFALAFGIALERK
jgi:uncharacterized membrane-anchored protein YitT (DUF2179 family)